MTTTELRRRGGCLAHYKWIMEILSRDWGLRPPESRNVSWSARYLDLAYFDCGLPLLGGWGPVRLFLINPPPGLVTNTIGHITDMAHHGSPELHSSLLFSFLAGLGSLNVSDSLRISSESKSTRIQHISGRCRDIWSWRITGDSSSPGSQMMSQEI